MLESKDAVLVATSIVLAVSTIVSVSVELERQASTVGRLTASKWLLVAGAFFALVMTSIVCIAAAKGLGASISAAEFSRRETLQKLIIAASPPYFLCNMFVKHAWLTFYYGLSQTRAQRWFIHMMQVLAAGFGISSVLVVLFQCVPLSGVWNRNLEPREEHGDAECINLMAFFYFNSIFMIVNDIVMYLIPMVLLWKVETIRDHRRSLYALFGICFLVIVASVLRLVAVYEVDHSTNLSENYALIFLWAGVENHVGICTACAGALKTKWCTTYKKVRALSMDLKNKSWLASMSTATSSSGARTSQCTEERRLYERTSSNASSLHAVPAENVKGPYMRMELVGMHPGKRISLIDKHYARTSPVPPQSPDGS
ncbi:hypothetical protein A1O7_00229 [Cladophialophora yegresii CBS 114405]|uniref:Rhodopsin domain-containing protein n=1 Tax=Cladophialophora yegresii CBS 114405 TaxID=1182544 RepID=W9X087_9EURO|nr:uncharacterized protein A1O7_00229 [Cladophialophora yegresii CBS 114405]EXJ63894.1 hypothetical protein A1O7_00229 [Cladophialophora yegresii CBS 114405]